MANSPRFLDLKIDHVFTLVVFLDKNLFLGNLNGRSARDLELIDLVFGSETEVAELRKLASRDQLSLCKTFFFALVLG